MLIFIIYLYISLLLLQEVYGFFYNEEKEARRNTLIKEKRWDCIANKVEKKWNDAVFDDKKPKVCWAYYLADNYGYDSPGFVWANSCKNGTLEDDFYCKLADSCHAELITGPGSEWYENILDFDATFEKLEGCDTIIYSGYYRNLEEVIVGENPGRTRNRTTAKEVLQRTTAWKNGKVFDVTKSGSNNWHENRVVHYGKQRIQYEPVRIRWLYGRLLATHADSNSVFLVSALFLVTCVHIYCSTQIARLKICVTLPIGTRRPNHTNGISFASLVHDRKKKARTTSA